MNGGTCTSNPGFQRGRFVLVGRGGAFDFRGGVGDFQINGIRQSYDDRLAVVHADLDFFIGLQKLWPVPESVIVQCDLVVIFQVHENMLIGS